MSDAQQDAKRGNDKRTNQDMCSCIRLYFFVSMPRPDHRFLRSALDMKFGPDGFLCWSAFAMLATSLAGGLLHAAGEDDDLVSHRTRQGSRIRGRSLFAKVEKLESPRCIRSAGPSS